MAKVKDRLLRLTVRNERKRNMRDILKVDLKKEGRQIARDYAVLVLGTLAAAISFNLFFIPYDIAPGGVTGIATVAAHFLPLGVGFLSFVINLPLFMAGFRSVGWRFALRSFVAMMLLSLFIDTLPQFDLTGNQLLATVFGGVLLGVGLGLVVRAGATTGGTDMAASLLHRYVSFLSIPVILFGIDAVVVMIAAMVFGLEAGFYALIALYVSSKAMDMVIKGVNTAMQFMIITSAPEAITARIHTELERGCTRLEATGTYSGNPVGTLICVISRMEAARLKKIVAEEDPRAFVTVCDVHEALGEGFTGMN